MDRRERDYGGRPRSILPVSRIVDKAIPTVDRVIGFFDRIRHPNGAVNPHASAIEEVMRAAKRDNMDVLLRPTGQHLEVVVGRFVSEHERIVKVGAGVVLTAGLVAGAAGFWLRRHRREPPKPKK